LNVSGQCNVPALPAGLSYVELSSGQHHAVARRSDGSVVAWGFNGTGQCNVPPLPPGLSYVGISASVWHTLALRSDGTVVSFGGAAQGLSTPPPPPAGLVYVKVSAGFLHSLGLLSDGTVVAWGDNSLGQCIVPSAPPGLTYADISAGTGHSVAQLSDGSLVAWGNQLNGECAVPSLQSWDFLTFSAKGAFRNVALLESDIQSFCFGDGSAAACPCANSGATGRGCENSGTSGGALLAAAGVPDLQADTIQLTSSGELPSSLSIVLQGNSAIAPVSFGDGVRCVGGLMKRLYMHNAVGGVLTVPQAGDLPVSARSAALGAPIAPGETRYYQVYYRDPVAGFCAAPQGSTFNVSNGLAIEWGG